MNINRLWPCPWQSAFDQCDQHVSKMATESVQILVQAALTAGVPPELMPPTKSTGKPHRGGYKHHPAVIWAGESVSNWIWLFYHAEALCQEFHRRRGKEHFAQSQINHLLRAFKWGDYLPNIPMTPSARCFNQSKGENLDLVDYEKWPCDYAAYREFYRRDKAKFARWEWGVSAPKWRHGEPNLRIEVKV